MPISTSGTIPEQVHLTWGADPATSMTVSWLSPGPQPQPSATLLHALEPVPSTQTGTAVPVRARSFVDGANGETVHAYHATLTGLLPATTYHYRISDGAVPPNGIAGQFTTPPAGRTPWAFTSFGDLSTPTAGNNVSGITWKQSSDNAFWAVSAIVAEADGSNGPAPLFHLLNGDLCYANLDVDHQPEVWRDFGRNIERSAASIPWMPCLGNHEIEFGANGHDGTGAGIWNGPFGYGNYQTRFELPDNGVPGYRGHFYSFQIGGVLFISLDADDVVYQDGGTFHDATAICATPGPPTYADKVTVSGVVIEPGQSVYNRQYSGQLVAGPDDSLVPDRGSGVPNRQTIWLEQTLAAARRGSPHVPDPAPDVPDPGPQVLDGEPVDMIVVQMHQCALSSSSAGNGSDLGIRQAWLPLFDRYGVDLVVSGHEHNYERSHAVRGYRPDATGTVVAPNPGQLPAGSAVFTRQPLPVPEAERTVAGVTTVDTSRGTVFLVLGGGGTNGPTNVYGTGPDGRPQAKVITERNRIGVNGNGKYAKNPADSVEPAPWSAQRDPPPAASSPGCAYGYARFDVDPGQRQGDTTITMRYRHARRVGSGESFVGPTSYSLLETVVYGRNLALPPP